ncbi:MAG: hypothetical protein WA977_06095 [Halobacteriota archaeon]
MKRKALPKGSIFVKVKKRKIERRIYLLLKRYATASIPATANTAFD